MSKIVRRPDRAEGGITPAEREAMAEHVKLWIARAMRTAPIEPDKIVPAIEGLYAAAGLKKPRVVVVPSPLVMAFAYGASAAIWHARSTDAATRAATDAATAAATDAATDATTRAATRAATDAATAAATACAELAGGFGLACASRWSVIYQGGNMWATWDSYLAAARDILGLRLASHEKYAAWEAAAIHGGFRVMHPEFCLVSDFPERLRVDDQHRPHCEDGPSHCWRDGWSLYHWHGVRIPAEWIEDKASLTPAIALSQENVELRRVACEILGWARILRELKAKTIQKDPDPEIGELIEVDLPDAGKERFLRVRCGTGREFAIPVPRAMKTALEANAWTYDIPANLLQHKEFRT